MNKVKEQATGEIFATYITSDIKILSSLLQKREKNKKSIEKNDLRDMNRQFTKKELKMTFKVYENMFNSLRIRGKQIPNILS